MRNAICFLFLVLGALGVQAEEKKLTKAEVLKGTGPDFADMRTAVTWEGVSLERLIEKAGKPAILEKRENGDTYVFYEYTGLDNEKDYCRFAFVFNKDGEISSFHTVRGIPAGGTSEESLCLRFPARIDQ